MQHEAKEVEHLVIGTGVAGLSLALKLAAFGEVLLISKGALEESNSFHAQGGIASVLSSEDSFAEHVADTLEAGAGLCHPEVVRTIVEAGPQAIAELLELGVAFTRQGQRGSGEALHLTREGGHSRRRVIHAKDVTGQAMVNALIRAARQHPRITICEHQFAIDLLTSDKYCPSFSANYCLGAYIYDKQAAERGEESSIYLVRSAKTFLATGGHGRVYLYTSNPAGATGDGLAMGWRAGCKVANLEFMQFHPTCLFHPEARTFLISEAVRGEGGILKNAAGQPFMEAYHRLGSLAPRDIVARAIDAELKKSGESKVYLDVRALGRERLLDLFPHIYDTCRRFGIDMATDMIPVVPAAHYSCGGLLVDSFGQTTVRNLYAVGEVACSGLHGANRLASNSLLEACVLADRAAQHARDLPPPPFAGVSLPPWNTGRSIPPDEQVILSHNWDEIRRLMGHYVGIVRSDSRLQRALSRVLAILQELDTYYWQYQVNERLLEVRNLAQVAWLTIRCAMSRKESRGIHYNLDHPETASGNPRDTVIW